MDGKGELSAGDEAWLDDCFTYHAPNADQVERLKQVTEAFKNAAKAVLLNVPASPDRTVALRAIRETRMWANAAIVLDGRR
jgi:hypothetical protein